MPIDMENFISNGAKLKVIGVGGGGSNAVDTMITRNVKGVEFIACNTDAQALARSLAPIKLQLGKKSTRGLGAGGNPQKGKEAVIEDQEAIRDLIAGSDMVFITAGMGGGTGTGAAPVIGKIAKDLGALTVAIVTKPFLYEGMPRTKNAESGIEELRPNVDTLIVIHNQKILSIIDNSVSAIQAYSMVNDVLHDATKGISELINKVGMINLDFADVKTVLAGKGNALIGIGRGTGADRATDAAMNAISSPLLDGLSIAGAEGALVNIMGPTNMPMIDMELACEAIKNAAGENCNLIMGSAYDDSLGDEIVVTVVAAGFGKKDETVQVKTTSGSTVQVKETPIIQLHTKETETQENHPVMTPSGTINKVPFNYEELMKRDTPAYLRKGINIEGVNSGSNSKTDKQRIERSGQDEPLFIRRIMD